MLRRFKFKKRDITIDFIVNAENFIEILSKISLDSYCLIIMPPSKSQNIIKSLNNLKIVCFQVPTFKKDTYRKIKFYSKNIDYIIYDSSLNNSNIVSQFAQKYKIQIFDINEHDKILNDIKNYALMKTIERKKIL